MVVAILLARRTGQTRPLRRILDEHLALRVDLPS
jgi:hypothetical protein